jgi:hypothetical protein
MRVAADTNILIRAVIKPDRTVGPVLRRLVQGDYVLMYWHFSSCAVSLSSLTAKSPSAAIPRTTW